MQYGQINIRKFKAFSITPACLLIACVSNPQSPQSDNAFQQTEIPYYFEHISDELEDEKNKPALPLAPLEEIPPSKETEVSAKEKTKKTISPPKFSLQQRMPKVDTSEQMPSWLSSKSYSFKAKNLDVRDALRMFSKIYGLNIYYEPEVTGEITAQFTGLPLKKALEVILNSHKYYWQWQDNLIYVGKYQTKNYVINYIRLTRTSSATSNTAASSQNKMGNNSTISQSDNISFWDELEIQLTSLISESGKLTINKTTGNIQVTDVPDNMKQIELFINNIKKTLTRQVIIEARIIEVQLNNDNRLGVDWENINFLNFTAVSSTLSGLTNGGLNLKAATTNLTYNDSRFKAMVSALSEQGTVKVMSQPRIRTLNNQPAIIKSGTDRTFFSTTATATTSNGVTQVVTSEQANTVTEGVILSITPQISGDGKIILDVSPVLTRIADVTVSKYGSTAPVLDIKQSNALIQTLDGEMIVIGGMIQDTKIKRKRSVPFLGDLPWIGALFRSESTSEHRTELVICLVAKII